MRPSPSIPSALCTLNKVISLLIYLIFVMRLGFKVANDRSDPFLRMIRTALDQEEDENSNGDSTETAEEIASGSLHQQKVQKNK